MRRASTILMTLLACACGDGTDPGGDASADAAEPERDAGPPLTLPDAGEAPDAGPTLLGPPYPIVLCHGFFGFDDFAGAGFLTYFYEVREHLGAQGEVLVFTPEVDPFNSSEVRGEMLIARVEEILATTGHAKVNLIGHSQGGLDARYVASVRPDLVASVTTYATPNRGSPISDVVLGLVSDSRLQSLADALVRLIGAPLYDAAGEETSVVTALRQFSTPGIEEFNAMYPDDPSVAYYSLTGRTDLHDGGSDCDATDIPPFVSRYRRELDPVDLLLDIPEQIVDGGLGESEPNDGLVTVNSARWGRFLGCVPADHLDEVGQLLGDSPGLGNGFDYQMLFTDLVAFLRAEGH